MVFKNKIINIVIRGISLLIPIFIIILLKFKNDSNYFFLTQLIGMGILLSNLISTEYHTEYMIAHSDILKKSFGQFNHNKLNKLWSIYIKKIFLHVILALPLVFILLRPNNLILSFLLLSFVLGEKIFDELQRFLQIGDIDIPGYSMFIFSRRIIMLFPYIFINLMSSNKFLILIMFSCFFSNLFSWLIVKGKSRGFREISGLSSIFNLDFFFIKNFYLKGVPIKQFILSLSITSFKVIPFLIVSNNVQEISEMANFSLLQRIFSLPAICYSIIFFSANRLALIKMGSNSKKKLEIIFHNISLSGIIVISSIVLIFLGSKFYLVLLALVQAVTSIFLLVPIDRIYWNFSLNKKLMFFMPSFIASILIYIFISNTFIAISLYVFLLISLLMTSYKKYFANF